MYKINKINKTILINATRECVYSALTNSQEILKFFPLTAVISDWKVGSEVLYKGEVDGIAFTDFGVIEEFENPDVYSYRYWSDNHGTERLPENHLTISYRLLETTEGTELTMTQSNIKSHDMYKMMNDQVWDYLLGSLKAFTAS